MNVVKLLNKLIGKNYVLCNENNNYLTDKDSITIDSPILSLRKMQKRLDEVLKE